MINQIESFQETINTVKEQSRLLQIQYNEMRDLVQEDVLNLGAYNLLISSSYRSI